jgi:hypothetical protein
MIERDAALITAAARLRAEVRSGVLYRVAKPDLLVGHKPGQTHAIRLPFAGAVRLPVINLFRHAIRLRPLSIAKAR